ncbi:MAG: VOC family protein [Merismopedia sp. SIO2A8]|nr:VOC family protein [Merismopedia sp. SIO2A8]
MQWEQMVYFYHHLANGSPNPHVSRSYAEFHLGGLRIGLFHPKASHQSEFAHPKGAGISLCLEVEDLDQSRIVLDHIHATLPPPVALHSAKADGSGSPSLPYGPIAIASHGRECYAYDPDGNRLILHESAAQPETEAIAQA